MKRVASLFPALALAGATVVTMAFSTVAETVYLPTSADTLVMGLLRIEVHTGVGFDGQYPTIRGVDSDIHDFYEANGFQVVWFDGTKPIDQARELIGAILTSDKDGLNPAIYRPEKLLQALKMLSYAPAAGLVVEADLEFTRAFFQFAAHHLEGQVDPSRLSGEVFLKSDPASLESVLSGFLGERYSGPLRDRLAPRSDWYRGLQSALEDHRKIADGGAWPTVPAGGIVAPGDTDPRFPALRARLAATGELDAAEVDDDLTFDDALLGALAKFQARSGLAVDSTLGPITLAALNVSVEQRIRQIELSMERLRWLPDNLGARYVLVNIPEFKVHGYEGEDRKLEMRVVVGSQFGGKETPVFRDEMEHVVFNPYWNVPHSIATQEMIPRIREDESYLRRLGLEMLSWDGEVLPAGSVALEDIQSGVVRIRQKPGPSNSLGLVKFMFPNPYGIYMHDTPSDYLFSLAERDFSHGCIRLADPARFGAWTLGVQGWSLGDVEAAIDAVDHQVVRLDKPIPVYIMYLTAVVGKNGMVTFRNDIYGNDEVLSSALESVRTTAKEWEL